MRRQRPYCCCLRVVGSRVGRRGARANPTRRYQLQILRLIQQCRSSLVGIASNDIWRDFVLNHGLSNLRRAAAIAIHFAKPGQSTLCRELHENIVFTVPCVASIAGLAVITAVHGAASDSRDSHIFSFNFSARLLHQWCPSASFGFNERAKCIRRRKPRHYASLC